MISAAAAEEHDAVTPNEAGHLTRAPRARVLTIPTLVPDTPPSAS